MNSEIQEKTPLHTLDLNVEEEIGALWPAHATCCCRGVKRGLQLQIEKGLEAVVSGSHLSCFT
jgi:hypothetical protein